jgi:hypothetical protein
MINRGECSSAPWFTQNLRDALEALIARPSCGEGTDESGWAHIQTAAQQTTREIAGEVDLIVRAVEGYRAVRRLYYLVQVPTAVLTATSHAQNWDETVAACGDAVRAFGPAGMLAEDAPIATLLDDLHRLDSSEASGAAFTEACDATAKRLSALLVGAPPFHAQAGP